MGLLVTLKLNCGLKLELCEMSINVCGVLNAHSAALTFLLYHVGMHRRLQILLTSTELLKWI